MLCSYLGYSQVSVTATTGTTGPTAYTTVKAAFDAINAGTHTGSITVTITANTAEAASAALNASGTGSASYTAVLIKPAASATPSIVGNVNGPVLAIRGSNVTIDGSNNGTTTRDLTISNLDTSQAKLAVIALLSSATVQLTNITIKNAVISKGFIGIAASEATFTNPTGQFANITIQNNRVQGSYWGIFVVAATATGNGSFTVKDNDLSATGTNAIYNMGVYLQGVNGSTISGNTIGNFDPSEDGDDVGIWLATGSSGTIIEKNKVLNLGYTGTAGYGAHGIRVSTGTPNANVSVRNNMIANIFGDGWDYTDPDYGLDNPIGILATGAQSGISLHYNSIHMYGNRLDGLNTISAGVYLGTGTTVSMKNNIVVNNHGLLGTAGWGAIGLFLGSAPSQLVEGDFNNYYVNPTGSGNKFIGQIGATGYSTLNLWQSATGKEGSSRNVLPVFVSQTDLHLVPASNAALSNLGTPVAGITGDIDDETRSTTTPDMGADEFAGAGGDVSAPGIGYTILGFACGSGNRTLSGVTISDGSGVPTSGALMPRIYYKKSTGSTWYSQPGTLTAGTGTSGTWSFTIVSADMGTLAPGETIQYYVIAQDLATTPNIGSNPGGVVATNVNTVTTHPTPNSYVIGGNLSGNYNVGSGQTYATLTAAVAAYNTGCLNGAVTFTLMDATYPNETFPIVIQHNAMASATNTLTIKPGTGVSATINGTSAVALIHLKGADYVTIDGSNTVGGITRNLTITTTGTDIIPMIWITSGSSSDGANNNTVKNVILTGNTSTAAGVLTGSSAILGDASEFPNNGNTLANLAITKVQNGIFVLGNTNAASFDQGWTIIGNTIGSTTAANKLSIRGIFIADAQDFIISRNTITGIVSSATSTFSVAGIAAVVGINGGLISQNTISDIKQTNPSGLGAHGIQLSTSTTASNLTIVNNFISDVAGQGKTTNGAGDNGYGIVVANGGGFNIYYNTVNMNTNQNLAGSVPSAFHVAVGVTTAGAINLLNNIFVNTQTSGTQRFAISSAAPNTVFANINYNNYYSSGPNIGFIGSARATLTDIVAGFGGNANSKNVLPVFVSASDLHLSTSGNAALDNSGTPIVGITLDIDNDARSATTPDMGADEFTNSSACTNPVITVQPAPFTTCLQQSATFTVTATGTNLTYQWQFNGANIPGATNPSFTINNITATFAGGYRVVVSSGSCSVTSNVANLTVSGPCTSIPNIDEDISSVVLMPNLVNNATTLRVNAGRSTHINWTVVDMNGKVVMTFNSAVSVGQNDIKLIVSKLGAGTYHIMGQSAKGRTEVLRMIKF